MRKKRNQIYFNVKIKFDVKDEKYMNTSMGYLTIRLKNNDIILYKESLKTNDLKEFNSYEDYYLAEIDDKIDLDDESTTFRSC